jgi:hypothetical protein
MQMYAEDIKPIAMMRKQEAVLPQKMCHFFQKHCLPSEPLGAVMFQSILAWGCPSGVIVLAAVITLAGLKQAVA